MKCDTETGEKSFLDLEHPVLLTELQKILNEGELLKILDQKFLPMGEVAIELPEIPIESILVAAQIEVVLIQTNLEPITDLLIHNQASLVQVILVVLIPPQGLDLQTFQVEEVIDQALGLVLDLHLEVLEVAKKEAIR